jgi:hypothetical protein
LGVELSAPDAVVLPPDVFTFVSTGKFCKRFPPVSGSPPSLGVTPFTSRSIPSPPFV